MILKDCLEKIIDNRGRNPKYYDNEAYPVIDNVMIKNNYHPNINEATRFIDQDTHDNFLRGYLEPNIPIMTLVGGGIGNVSLSIDEKSVIVQNTIGFKTNPKVLDSIYLYYWFLYKHDELIQFNRGSGQPSIRKTDIENMNIELKDINYQRKVSKILSEIDEKIELNNKINNNLYELIKNNYEALISNCDWEEVELGTIANITSGKRPIDKLEIGEYPVIGANGVMAYTNDFNFNEDLIITGRVGTLGIVKRYAEQIWASDNTLVVQTKYLNYIENYMRTIDYYSLNRGSTQPLLTQGDLKKQIVMFKEESILKFEKENQIFMDKIRNNEKENKNLEQLRDTLLPKLMNGEIDLNNIEI